MSAAVWYWRRDNHEHGPITWEKLQSLAVKGRIGPNDWVRRDGWNDWRLACEAQEDSGPPTTDEMPPPLPPPLPLHSAEGPAMVPAPTFAGIPAVLPAEPPPLAAPPIAQYAPIMSGGAPGLMPLMPPLPPLEPVGDEAPPLPQEIVRQGDVQQLRSALMNGPSDEPQAGPPFNYAAAGAMAAAVVGLIALPFETGLLALALGGWAIRNSDPANGRNLAVAAVAIGGVNVVFRVLVATVDLGLTL